MRRSLLALLLVTIVVSPVAPATADDGTTDTDYGRMILVLDSSGSMAEPAGSGSTTKIQAAQTALDGVVDDLPDDAYVGLRVYGATVFSKSQPGACQDSQLVVPPGTDNRDDLHSALEDYQPYGETPIGYALEQAAKDIGAEGTRSIVLVSDGEATCAPDPCKVAGRLADRGIDLQIDVVGLAVDGKARAQLRCVASRGNGTYYDADSADEIADSLQTASERAVRPFALEGTPVRGGLTMADATPVTPGRWVDSVGENGSRKGERWYSIERTMRGSTISIGVSSLGSSGASTDTIEVATSGPDGTPCGLGNDLKQLNASELLGAEVQVGKGTSHDSEACRGNEVLVTISRNVGGIGDGTAPYALRVMEEPPVTGVGALPGPLNAYDAPFTPPHVTGRAKPVTAGTSFGTATPLTSGRYSSDIVPGETQVYAVDLDYGQSLAVRASAPTSRAVDNAFWVFWPWTQLDVFGPLGGDQTVSQDSDPFGRPVTDVDNVMTLGLPEIRYRNRESYGGTGSVAGTYYLVYSLDTDPDGADLEIPYRLDVEVRGTPHGQPTYADGASPLGTDTSSPSATPTDNPTSDSEQGGAGEATPSTEGDGPPITTLAAVGLLLVAAACAVGGVLVLRRGRS